MNVPQEQTLRPGLIPKRPSRQVEQPLPPPKRPTLLPCAPPTISKGSTLQSEPPLSLQNTASTEASEPDNRTSITEIAAVNAAAVESEARESPLEKDMPTPPSATVNSDILRLKKSSKMKNTTLSYPATVSSGRSKKPNLLIQATSLVFPK